MKIALYQGPGRMADIDANIAIVRAQTEAAVRAGARLVIFPEMFLTGYNIGDAIARLAQDGASPALDALGDIAKANDAALICGYPERDGEALYNAAALFGADGARLAGYRKTHLFGDEERTTFSAGDAPALATIDGITVGILICYDVEFPEPVRLLAAAGAQLIAVPTAAMTPYEEVARCLIPARALENQVFVAYANRCGSENGMRFFGRSCVVGPDGAVRAQAGADEAMLFAEASPADIERAHRPYHYLAERRDDVYAAWAALRR